MFIVAKAEQGREFFFSAKSAHRVAKKNAQKICEILNELKFALGSGEVWHTYEVAEWQAPAYVAADQSFTLRRNGALVRKNTYDHMNSKLGLYC